jgi:hypothetical protein
MMRAAARRAARHARSEGWDRGDGDRHRLIVIAALMIVFIIRTVQSNMGRP